MDSEYQRRLEQEVERELKALPDLPAPATLAPRVLAAIARRAHAPFYRRSWQMWPLPLKAASLTLSAALIVALSFALWTLPHNQAVASSLNQVGTVFSWAGAVWNAVSAVVSAAFLVVKQLNAGLLIGCLLLVAMAWAMCVGLGTVYMRLALARR